MQMPKAAAFLSLLLLAGLPGLSAPAMAETAEEKGLAIAEEMDRRDLGYGDSVTELEMILTNRQGKTSMRYLKIKTLEVEDRDLGDKSLVIFDRPPDVKGTVLLTHSKILEPDDQWIYFPALGQKGRIKRIDSRSKSGPFMGSEFSYEDMSSREVGKYSYKWLRDEACGSMTCHVVESYPLYEGSGYTKIISWIDTDEYRVHKIEFFNRGGAHFKTLIMSKYQKYLDKYWRAHELYMVNKLTGKTTRLLMSRYDFQQGLEDIDFTKSRMKTAK
ncbi:outer membrane lipoprotein-sorting protein [Emcibacter nanhaiensis]|nr:outer membrane lipoprotein-sorting protein [Emcibacter nanhaiensis]